MADASLKEELNIPNFFKNFLNEARIWHAELVVLFIHDDKKSSCAEKRNYHCFLLVQLKTFLVPMVMHLGVEDLPHPSLSSSRIKDSGEMNSHHIIFF